MVVVPKSHLQSCPWGNLVGEEVCWDQGMGVECMMDRLYSSDKEAIVRGDQGIALVRWLWLWLEVLWLWWCFRHSHRSKQHQTSPLEREKGSGRAV